MAVVPLIPGKSVARTEEEFEQRGARRGGTLLIRNFENTQLLPGSPNLSYDLRVGSVYKGSQGWFAEGITGRRQHHPVSGWCGCY